MYRNISPASSSSKMSSASDSSEEEANLTSKVLNAYVKQSSRSSSNAALAFSMDSSEEFLSARQSNSSENSSESSSERISSSRTTVQSISERVPLNPPGLTRMGHTQNGDISPRNDNLSMGSYPLSEFIPDSAKFNFETISTTTDTSCRSSDNSFSSEFTVHSAPPALQEVNQHAWSMDDIPEMSKDDSLKPNRRKFKMGKFDPGDGLILDVIPTLDRELENGQMLMMRELPGCILCGSYEGDIDVIPDEIANGKMDLVTYKAILERLQNVPKFQHAWCYHIWLQAVILLCIFLLLWSFSLFVWYEAGLALKLGTGLFFVLALVVAAVFIGIFVFIKRKVHAKSLEKLTSINEMIMDKNLLIGLEEYDRCCRHHFILHFISFDVENCLDQIVEDLTKAKKIEKGQKKFNGLTEYSETGSIVIADTDFIMPVGDLTEVQRQDMARKLLLKNSPEYVTNLVKNKLGKPYNRRHCKNTLCLCQYVEQYTLMV